MHLLFSLNFSTFPWWLIQPFLLFILIGFMILIHRLRLNRSILWRMVEVSNLFTIWNSLGYYILVSTQRITSKFCSFSPPLLESFFCYLTVLFVTIISIVFDLLHIVLVLNSWVFYLFISVYLFVLHVLIHVDVHSILSFVQKLPVLIKHFIQLSWLLMLYFLVINWWSVVHLVVGFLFGTSQIFQVRINVNKLVGVFLDIFIILPNSPWGLISFILQIVWLF